MKHSWNLRSALVSPILILSLGVTIISPSVAEAAEKPADDNDNPNAIVQVEEIKGESDEKDTLSQKKDGDFLDHLRQMFLEGNKDQKKKEASSKKGKADKEAKAQASSKSQ